MLPAEKRPTPLVVTLRITKAVPFIFPLPHIFTQKAGFPCMGQAAQC